MLAYAKYTPVSAPLFEYKNKLYVDRIFCFDIETTSFFKVGEKWVTAAEQDPDTLSSATERLAIPYIWQFSVDAKTYYGRSLVTFYNFCKDILCKNYPQRKIVWVHNLSYEFAFLSQYFKFNKVFARKKGDVIYCFDKQLNIEFRCTYKLTVMPLKKIPESFGWVGLSKLVGDLNYDIARLPCTPLKPREKKYCEYDVQLIYQFIKGLVKEYNYKNLADIPYTQTGIIRRIIKTTVLNSSSHLRHMEECKPDLKDYRMLTRIMRGGVTQCQWTYIDGLLNNVYHVDIASSYPFVMCTKYYPSSKWEYGDGYDDDPRYLHIYTVKLYNVVAKSPWYYICYSKTERLTPFDGENNYYNGELTKKHDSLFEAINEGKVVDAKYILLTVTDVDLDIINKVYNVEKIEYVSYARSRKSTLPIPLIKYILSLYKQKTEIKGIVEKVILYNFLKQQLNGIYGMMLTNIFKDEPMDFGYNIWLDDKMDDKKLEEKLAKNKPFLNFSWGVYVTAYARQALFDLIMKFPACAIYCDTDSIFFIDQTNFKYVEEINKERYNELVEVSNRLGIALDYFIPTDNKGRKRPLGAWEREEDLKQFKSVGSKKYCMVTKSNQFIATIAGCRKKYFDFETNQEVATVKSMDHFYIAKDDSKKPRYKNGRSVCWHTIHQPHVELTDYLGNKYTNYQVCGIVVLNTYYTLGLTNDLNDFTQMAHNNYTNPYRYVY